MSSICLRHGIIATCRNMLKPHTKTTAEELPSVRCSRLLIHYTRRCPSYLQVFSVVRNSTRHSVVTRDPLTHAVSVKVSHALRLFLIYCASPSDLLLFLTHPPELSGNYPQRHTRFDKKKYGEWGRSVRGTGGTAKLRAIT
jgi:hypothetical protein